MSNANCMNIRMNIKSRTAWNTLLQRGLYIQGPAGRTVRVFLNEVFDYDDCFIDETVRTVFRNNSPVDDIDSAQVQEGDRMALGSAMPGLVGICMGRDNPYKDFRSDIACQDEEIQKDTGEKIRVFVKILSTLAVQTGEEILKRGIEVKVSDLANLLEEQKAHIISGPSASELSSKSDGVFITVEFLD